MFLNFLLILFLILNPLQPIKQDQGPQRINHQSLGIKTSAKSAIIIDVKSGKILYEKNAYQVLPIASLTKLITADVILRGPLERSGGGRREDSAANQKVDWDKIITIKHQDQAEGATLFVNAGEKVRVKDLFYSMLVGSANNAAKALVRSAGLCDKEECLPKRSPVVLERHGRRKGWQNLSPEEFVNQMNWKVQDLGLKSTHFTEPTGLSPKNVSTAYEIALLAKKAFENEKIKEATVMDRYVFRTIGEEIRHTIRNTDKLLISFLNQDAYKIIAGKTGYIEEAGYCLVSQVEKDGHQVIGVVLGTESKEARFLEMKGLIWWVFENWEWD